MWHVSSRSGVATLRTAIHLFFYLLNATFATAFECACQTCPFLWKDIDPRLIDAFWGKHESAHPQLMHDPSSRLCTNHSVSVPNTQISRRRCDICSKRTHLDTGHWTDRQRDRETADPCHTLSATDDASVRNIVGWKLMKVLGAS